MKEYRGFIVLGVSTVVILGVFFIFVAVGWGKNQQNSCIDEKPHDGCFCEHYNRADVEKGAPGVRQPMNTWFNLYAIFTALIVAIWVYRDRKQYGEGPAPNLISSRSWMPDLYIFAVLFLGLGSMWFHASLTKWGGTFDGMSMFVYASFLIFYSVRRLWNNALFFWVAYLGTVALNTALHGRVDSLYLILLLVAGYLAVEITIWVRAKSWGGGSLLTRTLWVLAVVAIGAVTVFWALSKTGGPLCDPLSKFQPHALLWHPLAGVMAVLLYFYWRKANEPVSIQSGLDEL